MKIGSANAVIQSDEIVPVVRIVDKQGTGEKTRENLALVC
jgi:hypothetical protein